MKKLSSVFTITLLLISFHEANSNPFDFQLLKDLGKSTINGIEYTGGHYCHMKQVFLITQRLYRTGNNTIQSDTDRTLIWGKHERKPMNCTQYKKTIDNYQKWEKYRRK